ncbi:MAG: alpha/beta fold hydrolase [Spirulina sp. DLM2.Bin59]|nr:MAG: alpha/beta fold hydrolase [Spirulina sp. DLM2.Bin59]
MPFDKGNGGDRPQAIPGISPKIKTGAPQGEQRLCFVSLEPSRQSGIQRTYHEVLTTHQSLPSPHSIKIVRAFFASLRSTLIIFGLVCSGTVLAYPAQGTESLRLQAGPIERTVTLEDLEQFAATGELPPTLQDFAPLITTELQSLLNQSFDIDRHIADRFLQDLLKTRDGQTLMAQIQQAIPHSSRHDLQFAMYETLNAAEKITPLTILAHYPQEELTIDLITAGRLALQLRRADLHSHILSPVLARELRVKSSRSPWPRPSFDPSRPGPHPVRQRNLIFQDRNRQRRISVDIYHSHHAQGPLIVLSHGFAADRRFMAYLGEHLASYGFTVVALEHPGSNIDLLAKISLNREPGEVLPAQEFIDRPLDIQFLLNEIERRKPNWPHSGGLFNTDQVVVVGHSLGGYTALALAGGELDLPALRSFCQKSSPIGRSPADWLQCSAAELPHRTLNFRDRRVIQAVALNPVIGHLFGPEGISKVMAPVMIFSHNHDAVAPILEHQLLPFRELTVNKSLITILGATHMSITDESNSNSTMAQSTLVREVMGAEAAPVRALVQGLILSLVQQHTAKAEIYRPFLSAAYVESRSTPELTMRFTRELPPGVNRWVEALVLPSLVPDATRSAWFNFNQRWVALQHRLRPPRSCRGQLNRIFNQLLS